MSGTQHLSDRYQNAYMRERYRAQAFYYSIGLRYTQLIPLFHSSNLTIRYPLDLVSLNGIQEVTSSLSLVELNLPINIILW